MLFEPKDSFQDGNQWTYQIWPVHLVYSRTGHFEGFSIANIGPYIEKNQIPVNILLRTVQLCCSVQNTAFKMGIKGHTRFDLYSSCTVVQGTLKNSPYVANIVPSIDKIQIPVNIPPRTVKLCCLDQKTAFKMGINGHTRFDLNSSCTDIQGTLKNSP